MTDNLTQKSNQLGQLGLPPMELAETNENERHTNYRCLIPLLNKIMAMLLLVMCALGLYILILKLLQTDDGMQNTKIILLTGSNEQKNISVVQGGIEIFLRLNNSTTTDISGMKRTKRNLYVQENMGENNNDNRIKLKDNDIRKTRQVIKEHNILCNERNNKDKCKILVMKLKSVIENTKNHQQTAKRGIVTTKDAFGRKAYKHNFFGYSNENDITAVDINKRETYPRFTKRNSQMEIPNQYRFHHNPTKFMSLSPIQYNQNMLPNRMEKHDNCPHHLTNEGLYPVPNIEYNQHFAPYSFPRHFPRGGDPAYFEHSDEVIEPIHKPQRNVHPQDFEIAMSVLATNPNASLNKSSANAAIREVDCPLGSISCVSGDACINENQWCDGKVDCNDVSDEAKCSCKSRVDKARICDSYFDCPFGEDEMGCNGCSETMFSCRDLDINSRGTCFTKDQRCNNVVDCPNQRDEIECSMLAPTLHKKPLFAVSNTEGFLNRNFKGSWYAVCENPYIWAHEACRREVGLVIGPPHIQYVPVDPMVKVNYLNTSPGGLIHISNNCFNSSAAYVVCSDIPCGTRVLTKAQLINENAAIENHIFGRNKRFFQPDPYNIFFRHRFKRHIESFGPITTSELKYVRQKRTESRVVGGKPSQPAAWPWMVALYRDGTFHCGGVIISHKWIMSAAHCVYKFWLHYYEIQVGMLRRFSFSPQEQNHHVTHIIINKNYNQENMKSDLSLLKVKSTIQFSRWVRPICLPGPKVAGEDWMWGPAPNTVCTAVGWGATVEHGADPDHMREVEVPIWGHCKHQEDQAGNEICAGFVEGGRDACQGDSGGPLLCRNPMNSQQWYIAGIVSHGDGCARKNEPGVYTRVSIFVEWIKYHIFSMSLPIIQPKQECPGFRCQSGISKCIPKRRMCDTVIDCLDGEDETNCDFEKSRNLNNNLFTSTSNDLLRAVNVSDIRNLKVNEIGIENTNYNTEVTTSSLTVMNTSTVSIEQELNLATTENNFLNLSLHEIQNTLKKRKYDIRNLTIGHIQEPHASEFFTAENVFRYASTIEIPKYDSSEDGVTESEEIVTLNPTKHTVGGDIESELLNKPFSSKIESTSLKIDNTEEKTQIHFSTTTQTAFEISTFADNIVGSNEINDALLKDDINLLNNETKSKLWQVREKKVAKNANFHSVIEDTTQLIIELLPTINTNDELSGETTTETHTSELPHRDKNTDIKVLPDFHSSGDFINQIENLVISQMQPASVRRKHRVPEDFQCLRIIQTVPYINRCDRKADCEDGTDEIDCACIDYLTTFDKTLICDGNLDCSEGQDEDDCFGCADDQFLCKRSQMCLSSKAVCDGIPQCPQGEDELDCYALTNGMNIEYDIDERPKVNLEGYLTRKHNNDWHIVCEDNLSISQQDQAATHICRYLGFSSANRYFVKYVNIKEDSTIPNDNKRKRSADKKGSVKFTYRHGNNNEKTRQLAIDEPQILKEECVPNVTRICMSLYVFCDQGLFTDIDSIQSQIFSRESTVWSIKWPWIAKIFVDGDYKCSGVLIDISWVLIGHSCIKDVLHIQNRLLVVLGSHRTLSSMNGPYEQIFRVDFKRIINNNTVVLLHLMGRAKYSNFVKPMVITSSNYQDDITTCVAIGQDNNNNIINVFLKESNKDCDIYSRCFIRQSNTSICENDIVSQREWVGIISCHSKHGWFPAASFVDYRGECGIGNRIISSDIGNLKLELKQYTDVDFVHNDYNLKDDCEGVRCSRGKCIKIRQLCDGIRDCEDGIDELETACTKKRLMCNHDPLNNECECPVGELKCRNGLCVSKELFRNGRDDCGDGTDEPVQTICSDYLSKVMPSRICDGIIHCQDRSDEDPTYCKCFARRVYNCNRNSTVEDYCVAADMVCDGIRDCPNGEDEKTCIGLSAPQGTPYGTGKVIIRSHGVWYSKCYHTQNHTKTELEAICRELGFISGHAKQLPVPQKSIGHPHNSILIDSFSEIVLNNNTMLKLRNKQVPIAKAVILDNLETCHPVYIECI